MDKTKKKSTTTEDLVREDFRFVFRKSIVDADIIDIFYRGVLVSSVQDTEPEKDFWYQINIDKNEYDVKVSHDLAGNDGSWNIVIFGVDYNKFLDVLSTNTEDRIYFKIDDEDNKKPVFSFTVTHEEAVDIANDAINNVRVELTDEQRHELFESIVGSINDDRHDLKSFLAEKLGEYVDGIVESYVNV